MNQVTVVRCSGLARPMSCAGSLALVSPYIEAGPAAAEGTAFGEFVQYWLEKRPVTDKASNGVPFDEDMKFHAASIIPLIGEDAKCETRIDWQTRSGIWIKGSYDISFVRNNKLYIDDCKYGWNIVDVKENWQLLGYAIGEMLRLQPSVQSVVMRIHQPRPHHEDGPTREWEISLTELWQYRERIEERMAQIASGFTELATGKQCKYCPHASASCTAFNRAFYAGVDHVMNHHQQDNVNDKEIAHQLDLIARIQEIVKIKSDSLNQLAIDRVKNGAVIPNYMTEASYGDRKWKKCVSPLVIETLTGKKITETVMLSPAKAEKLGVPKDLVKTFVDRHFVGMKLVRKDANELGNKIFNT